MTIPEFLERLQETTGRWVLVDGCCIRHGDHCPLTSLVPECDGADDWLAAADALGLDFTDAMTIVDIADGMVADSEDEETLRAQLLAATVNRS